MPSRALEQLQQGLDEVSTLLEADPTPPGGFSTNRDLTRAITRACIVLLSSHLERYLRAINEEAVELVNEAELDRQKVPLSLRLQHSGIGIDELAQIQWDQRREALVDFVDSDAWFWADAGQGPLDHRKLLRWMKSPKSDAIRRLFQLWGFEDVFTTITRATHVRLQLRLKMDELVHKRNNIAHGRISTEATPLQVSEYIDVVHRLCDRADRYLSRKLFVLFGIETGWY